MALVPVVVLLLQPPASALASDGVVLVPIAIHPYPDAADPLGFPYFEADGRGIDYFEYYYGRYDEDRNGFDFPSTIFDGVKFIEGAPGGDYEPTLAAYRDAFHARAEVDSPITLTVESETIENGVRVHVVAQSAERLSERRLALAWAIIEDDVYYRPPPALSNGVFVHRFTAREVAPRPPAYLDFSNSTSADATFDVLLAEEWAASRSYAAVWVQNEADVGSRFAFQEVVQATLHKLDSTEATVQERRGVLMVMFTATWCAACLFGDSAMNKLAADEGLASTAYKESPFKYLRDPDVPGAALGASLGLFVFLVAAPTLPLKAALSRFWRGRLR